jgi:hypothetical protein
VHWLVDLVFYVTQTIKRLKLLKGKVQEIMCKGSRVDLKKDNIFANYMYKIGLIDAHATTQTLALCLLPRKALLE